MGGYYGRMNSLAAELDRGGRMEGARTGTYVYWTPAIRCSCIGENGQASPTCRVCGGDGVFHPAALEKKKQAIITNALSHRQLVIGPGIIESDEIMVNFTDRIVVTSGDRIRFARPDLFHLANPAEGFTLERGTGKFDELPQRVARLVVVERSNDRTGAVTYYRPNVDVTFTGNKLYWAAKNVPPTPGAVMPPTGTIYAVTYHGDYDYLVAENLAPRHIGSVMMGTRALARRRLTDERNVERESPTGPGGFNPQLY